MACQFKPCQDEPVHCNGACHGVMPDGSPMKEIPETVNNQQPASEALLPHQQRVVDAKNDLDARLQRLTTFIEANPEFHKLTGPEQGLLIDQQHFMEGYLDILCQRIALFTP